METNSTVSFHQKSLSTMRASVDKGRKKNAISATPKSQLLSLRGTGASEQLGKGSCESTSVVPSQCVDVWVQVRLITLSQRIIQNVAPMMDAGTTVCECHTHF